MKTMTTLLFVLAAYAIPSTVAMADDCSDAVLTVKVTGQKHDRELKKAQARIDSISCCSTAYWQASCAWSKLYLQQVNELTLMLQKRSIACDKRDLDDSTKKQQREFTEQAQQKVKDDCETR